MASPLIRFSVKRPTWETVADGGASGLSIHDVPDVGTQYVHGGDSQIYFNAREALMAIKAVQLTAGLPDINTIRLIGKDIINSTEYTLGDFLDSNYADADFFMCYRSLYGESYSRFIVPCIPDSCW